jgi:hypothetical protein
MESEAFDVIAGADHPAPEDGGPCGTCAFRPGSQASQTEHTVQLANLCVEGIVPFHCHEQEQLCRGWIAAVNLQGMDGGLPMDVESIRHREASAFAADILSDAIAAGVEADKAAGKVGLSR